MGAESDVWIDRFLTHLRNERRLSDHTVSGYRRDLDALCRYLNKRGIPGWAALSNYDVRMFAAEIHRKGLSPRSVQRRLSAVRSFFRFLVREGQVPANAAADVTAPKAGKRLPETLDADQMAGLLEIEGDDALTCRDRAIMELLYSSGLRLSELVTLDLTDLDLADCTATVTGKGDKTRIVPVGRQAKTALERWLKCRGELAKDDQRAVFLSRGGGRLSRRSVQARVRHWARRQGVPTHVYPHLFRHSFATHVLESSGDLRGVQELLGHADISTTQIYTHLDFQHLARIYDKTHPRAKKNR